jgi:hypothetical protein
MSVVTALERRARPPPMPSTRIVRLIPLVRGLVNPSRFGRIHPSEWFRVKPAGRGPQLHVRSPRTSQNWPRVDEPRLNRLAPPRRPDRGVWGRSSLIRKPGSGKWRTLRLVVGEAQESGSRHRSVQVTEDGEVEAGDLNRPTDVMTEAPGDDPGASSRHLTGRSEARATRRPSSPFGPSTVPSPAEARSPPCRTRSDRRAADGSPARHSCRRTRARAPTPAPRRTARRHGSGERPSRATPKKPRRARGLARRRTRRRSTNPGPAGTTPASRTGRPCRARRGRHRPTASRR